MEMLKRLWNDEEGQGLVEYALIIVLVSLLAIGAMELLGGGISNVFTNIEETFGTAAD